jgi:homoserine kinase
MATNKDELRFQESIIYAVILALSSAFLVYLALTTTPTNQGGKIFLFSVPILSGLGSIGCMIKAAVIAIKRLP